MKDIMDLIEQGKIKSYFRVRNKYSFEGAVSHVTQRAPGKEPLFIEESDYLYMLYLIKEISRNFNFTVFSFALMLNHIHLLIRLTKSNLDKAMGKLFQAYAIYFNKKYERKGHAYASPYRSALCFDEGYLLAASLYIHANPVKANLVKNAADYRWSSCALFLNNVEKSTFIDYRFILTMLDNEISRGRLKYRGLLERIDVNKLKDISEHPDALEYIVEILKRDLADSGNIKWVREHGLLGDEDLYAKIEELKAKTRVKIGPQERQARKFMIEQLRSRGFKVSKIAEKLNLSRQSVHSYLTNA